MKKEDSEVYSIEFVETSGNRVKSFTLDKVKKNTIDKIDVCKSCDNIKIKRDEKIVIENFFSNEMIVEDVWRYCVDIKKSKYPYLQDNERDLKFKKSNYFDKEINEESENNIVLILESPHHDEYKMEGNKYIPIAPAQGDTGKGINENISLILNEMLSNNRYNIKLDDGKYRIIICNPVQYQTSLYYFHESEDLKTLRNNVWKKIFDQDDIEEDFKTRLERYKPKLIINACTSNLKSRVSDFIGSNFNNINYIETYHPSCWKNYIII